MYLSFGVSTLLFEFVTQAHLYEFRNDKSSHNIHIDNDNDELVFVYLRLHSQSNQPLSPCHKIYDKQ